MLLWKFPSSYFEILWKRGHYFYPQKKEDLNLRNTLLKVPYKLDT